MGNAARWAGVPCPGHRNRRLAKHRARCGSRFPDYLNRLGAQALLFTIPFDRGQMQVSQSDLFERPRVLPEGLKYQRELISPAAEHRLMQSFETLPFREFEFQGFLGKRRVVSFGWRYDFNGRGLGKAEPIPEILLPIRERAAQFAAIQADMLEHVLLTEYRAGATIGWHKDRKSFDDVIGVSFGAPCQFRLRRKQGAGWERVSFTAKPRSIYLLRGPARTEWEHSIPAADGLRYSITFRSLKHS